MVEFLKSLVSQPAVITFAFMILLWLLGKAVDWLYVKYPGIKKVVDQEALEKKLKKVMFSLREWVIRQTNKSGKTPTQAEIDLKLEEMCKTIPDDAVNPTAVKLLRRELKDLTGADL